MNENKKEEFTELDFERLDEVSGGNDPDPSMLEVWPWEQVEDRLKGYVHQFKSVWTLERAVQFMKYACGKSLVYPWAWGQDEDAIIDRFIELWNTYGNW